MAFHRYVFIEPSRPDPVPLRETLLASLAATIAAPTDNIELAGMISDLEMEISDGTSALLDAETPAEEAPALGEIKRHALTVLALIAAYEARS